VISRLRRAAFEDIAAVMQRDPAARSVAEVIICYPGVHAIWLHRLAHALYRVRLFLLARIVSHISRQITGIEIHPGARIGRRVVIDHGMGVVIGETAIVADDVLLYQGVTLGGTSLNRDRRHPTIGPRVVLGVGATVLGAIEVGEDARVGAGAVVTRPVDPGSVVVGVPAHPIAVRQPAPIPMPNLEHAMISDPVADAMRVLLERIERLEAELHLVRGQQSARSGVPEVLEALARESATG